MYKRIVLNGIVIAMGLLLSIGAHADINGSLLRDGKPVFPIACYELPGDDAALKAMADAGINLFRCGSRADLDRVHAVGALGWMPLPLDAGATDALRAQISQVQDHPALAVWEGPDEIVWNFTAFSGLYKTMGVYANKDEWWQQTPHAIEYSESKAAEIMPKMRAAVELLRSIDSKSRPVWINEAMKSDVKFVRQYLPFIDVTGCDIYPVSGKERKVERVGDATDRWLGIGKGKPVWMVLQAFSWDELGGDYADRGNAYPSFAESRFMAYDAIAHGAKGILYWGSSYLKNDEFRSSLYALTAELAAMASFLAAQDDANAKLRLIELPEDAAGGTVRMTARRAGDDCCIILVNDGTAARMGVEVSGLDAIEGRDMALLYGAETAHVSGGEIVVRLQPKEVKVYCTGKTFETARRDHRDYAGK